jgi:hypothetical protein
VNGPDWFQERWGIRNPDGTMATTWQGQVWMWETKEEAERFVDYFKAAAGRLGVADWQGVIVRQLSTPWIGESDNADGLVEELSACLSRKTGGEA